MNKQNSNKPEKKRKKLGGEGLLTLAAEALTSDNPGDALEKLGKRLKRDAHDDLKAKADKYRDDQDNIVNTEGEEVDEQDDTPIDTIGESA